MEFVCRRMAGVEIIAMAIHTNSPQSSKRRAVGVCSRSFRTVTTVAAGGAERGSLIVNITAES